MIDFIAIILRRSGSVGELKISSNADAKLVRVLAAGLKRFAKTGVIGVEQRVPDLDWKVCLPNGVGKGE